MVMKFFKIFLIIIAMPILAKDILLEFKTAYFLPTDCRVKKIYGNGGALYGPEVTFKLCKERNWYGFASVDYLSKKGNSIGSCSKTIMEIVPLAIGLKYFVPLCWVDLYAGLGFQSLHLTTKNFSPFVQRCTSQWGYGGIAKLGAYYDLPCNWFLDFFIDYSFVKVGRGKCCKTVPIKAKIDSALFGAGFGYRFD